MKFEDAGRAMDREVAKLLEFLDKRVKPETRDEAAKLLRRAAKKLDDLANKFDKGEK